MPQRKTGLKGPVLEGMKTERAFLARASIAGLLSCGRPTANPTMLPWTGRSWVVAYNLPSPKGLAANIRYLIHAFYIADSVAYFKKKAARWTACVVCDIREKTKETQRLRMADFRLCSIPDCSKLHLAQGLCSGHYKRLKRYGDPTHIIYTKTASVSVQCSVSSCDNPTWGEGLCRSHYRRQKRYGDPKKGPTTRGDASRHLQNVVLAYEGDDCLFWPFGRRRGYGVLGGKTVSRIVCEKTHGPPPTPHHVAAHSCGKGHLACVAKRHLSWKTPAGNKEDELAHGTRNAGERHGLSKLTADDVRRIRSLEGTAVKTLSTRFAVSEQQIRNIIARRVWHSV